MLIVRLAQDHEDKMGRLEPIIGTEIVDDIRLGHTWYEYSVIKWLIEEMKPEWFVEIGLHEGGLAYCLIPIFPEMGYFGVEINCSIIREPVKALFTPRTNKKLVCESCFNSNVFLAIQNLPNKIIYCDGGNKARELNIYKNACNCGDAILCHDFTDGIRILRGVTLKDWKPEVRNSDISDIEGDPMFERLDESDFKETRIVGWKRK